MTATLEQLEADLDRLITLAQRGEEIVITSHGRAIAKLSPGIATSKDRWAPCRIAVC